MNDAGLSSGRDEDVLDLRYFQCPWPVLKARKKLLSMAEGEVLRLVATDPMVQIDIPHYCAEAGHHVLEATSENGMYYFLIQRGALSAEGFADR